MSRGLWWCACHGRLPRRDSAIDDGSLFWWTASPRTSTPLLSFFHICLSIVWLFFFFFLRSLPLPPSNSTSCPLLNLLCLLRLTTTLCVLFLERFSVFLYFYVHNFCILGHWFARLFAHPFICSWSSLFCCSGFLLPLFHSLCTFFLFSSLTLFP